LRGQPLLPVLCTSLGSERNRKKAGHVRLVWGQGQWWCPCPKLAQGHHQSPTYAHTNVTKPQELWVHGQTVHNKLCPYVCMYLHTVRTIPFIHAETLSTLQMIMWAYEAKGILLNAFHFYHFFNFYHFFQFSYRNYISH
jgi:hypothetical protein